LIFKTNSTPAPQVSTPYILLLEPILPLDSKDDMRSLGMKFFPASKLAVQIFKNEWDDMIKLACILYGNSRNYKKATREFVKYNNDRRSSGYGSAL